MKDISRASTTVSVSDFHSDDKGSIPLPRSKNKRIRSYCVECGKGLSGYKVAKCRECWIKNPIVKFKFEDLKNHKSRRAWIIKECGLKCQICGIDSWMGKSLPIVLDHIDGNSDNNNRSNLRLICRNCDGQLPTFGAKNMGKGRLARRRWRNKIRKELKGEGLDGI